MRIFYLISTVITLILLSSCNTGPVLVSTGARHQEFQVYFGTYTQEHDGPSSKSLGIYRSKFDSEPGTLTQPHLAAEIESPSFLALHPSKQFLYAVTESKEGTVSSFSIGSSGSLTKINTKSTNGSAPCDLEVNPTGQMLVVANYHSGSTIAYAITEDGSLSNPTTFLNHEGSSVHKRQKSSHAHSVDFTPSSGHVIVSDLGTDKVMTMEVNPTTATIRLSSEISLAPGSGPRHFAFHPSGKFGYSLGELASTVTVMSHVSGKLKTIETLSTLPDGFVGHNTTAEIAVHSSGRFMYVSNRGHDSIAVFSVDTTSGRLSLTAVISSGGIRPRNFSIDPTGRYMLVAHRDSDNVVVFTIDQQTGVLRPTGSEIEIDAPVCVQFLELTS